MAANLQVLDHHHADRKLSRTKTMHRSSCGSASIQSVETDVTKRGIIAAIATASEWDDSMEKPSTPSSALPVEERYKLRFRFRVGPRLNIDRKSYPFKLSGYRGRIMAQTSGESIKDAQWLVAIMRGFRSAEEAKSLGVKLKRATSIAAAIWRVGIDVGEDIATSSTSDDLKDVLLRDHHTVLLDNVHGASVYRDNTPTMVLSFQGGMTTAFVDIEGALADIASLIGDVSLEDTREYQAVLLINAALLSPEALSRIVLAISAVELLAFGRGWSDEQKIALDRLADIARSDLSMSVSHRIELADALERLRLQSISAAINELISSLHLGHLKRQWSELYRKRSTIFHAKRYLPATQRDAIQDSAVNLSGKIVLAAIEARHPSVVTARSVMYSTIHAV